jgi:hypothetical protein
MIQVTEPAKFSHCAPCIVVSPYSTGIRPSSTETRHKAFPDPSSDITEDTLVEGHPYGTDIYINDDNIPDGKFIAWEGAGP